jgi:hypothetical protein
VLEHADVERLALEIARCPVLPTAVGDLPRTEGSTR